MFKKFQKISKNFDETKFKLYHSFHKTIKKNMHDAFWKSIEVDIKNLNQESFVNVLNEIKEKINKIVIIPSQKNYIQKDLNEKIDVELIGQMIKNNAYSLDKIIPTCKYILQILEKLQAPARTHSMWNEFEEKCKLVIPESIHSYGLLFEFIFNEIDLINQNIESISVLDKMGFNVFNI